MRRPLEIFLSGNYYDGVAYFGGYLYKHSKFFVHTPVKDLLTEELEDECVSEFTGRFSNFEIKCIEKAGGYFYKSTRSKLLQNYSEGVFFFVPLDQRLGFSTRDWEDHIDALSKAFPDSPIESFPHVICYNVRDYQKLVDQAERISQKAKEQGIKPPSETIGPFPPLWIPQKKDGTVELVEAKEELSDYFYALNHDINPYGFPYFLVCMDYDQDRDVYYSYNIEPAFLKLIELVEKRRKEKEREGGIVHP